MSFHHSRKCSVFSKINRMQKKQLITTPLALAISLILSFQVQSKEVFNIHALEIDDQAASAKDLSQFESGNQAPGIYHVDVYINNEMIDTREVEFVSDGNGDLIPKLSLDQYIKYGLNIKTIPALATINTKTILLPLSNFVPQAETKFDFGQQKLLISIPQANVNRIAQGAVDPSLWDEGLSALIANYSFSGSNNWDESNDNSRSDNYFLNLRTGLNLGGWRLRNYSTWNYNNNESDESDTSETGSVSHWNSINTYVQHDVQSLKSQFVAGDSYTPSDVFDSIQFRGAQLYSDDNMLPDSLKGFAPTVKGIASSNAQVTIRQNGNIIYQTYVPPGAFSINDLYPTSSSGDLRVTVKEADGSEHSFTQPFSNVPVMQREGRAKYSITAGKYRSQSSGQDEPKFGQGTIIYGLPHDITLYGGMQYSDYYSSYAGGLGIGLGDIGSISLDATQAYTDLSNGQDKQGQSYRFQYSKDIEATDSTVTLAGYRYSTEGFYAFSEALDERAYEDGNYSNDLQYNKRSKIQLNLTQNLMNGDWGSLSLSGYQQDYWGEEGYERNINVSYNNSLEGISWSLMYSYTESPGDIEQNEQQYALNVSIPLSKWLPNAYATTNFNTDNHGHSFTQVGLSGTALEDNNLSYNVSEGYDNKNAGNSGMVSGDYKGTYGEVNAGYNYNQDSKQINYGMQGSLFVHPYGVTLSQPVSENASMALIRAPGADNIKVLNNTGVRTDWRGYTVVPYLSPYRRSRVALDPTTMSENVDMDKNVQSVVPTSGALVLADFNTKIGYQMLITLTKNGKPVPFGTVVSLDNNDTGIVGDDGQVYLSGVPEKANLIARWGKEKDDECHKSFSVNTMSQKAVQQINLSCE